MRLGGDKITEWRIKLGMELELSLSFWEGTFRPKGTVV